LPVCRQSPMLAFKLLHPRDKRTGGNDLRLLLAIQQRLCRRIRTLLSIQSLSKTAFDESLPQILDGLLPTTESFGDATVGPSRAVGIGLQQNVGALRLWLPPMSFLTTSRKILCSSLDKRTTCFFCMGHLRVPRSFSINCQSTNSNI
jgi:hypothetical protein